MHLLPLTEGVTRCPPPRRAYRTGTNRRGKARFSAFFRHFENAYFLRRAETVFHGAEKLVIFFLFAFEIQHGVHNVFQHFRTGKRAFFGNVPDDEKGDAAVFGDAHQRGGAFAHLPYAARRARKRIGVDCLKQNR